MSQPKQPTDLREILPLTGIRGCAALFVIFYHFYDSLRIIFPFINWFHALSSRGYLGVDMFFVLSGFILCYVYPAGVKQAKRGGYLHFLWFRLARIFPNHLVTLAALLIMIGVAHSAGISLSGDYPLSGLLFQLSLTHAWPFSQGGEWNYPSWSISAEWFAYLTMFPLAQCLLRLNWRSPTLFLVALSLLAVEVSITSQPAFSQFYSLTRVSCEFLAGSLFYGIYLAGGSLVNLCHKAASWLFVGVFAAFALLPIQWMWVNNALIFLLPFILLSLTSDKSKISGILSQPTLLWLGRISYALYMSHAIVQKILKVVLPVEKFAHSSMALRIGLCVIYILALVACAAALYYSVEIPARNFLRRMANWWNRQTLGQKNRVSLSS